MASSRLSYLAIIKEAVTATAVKPTNFIRFKDGDVMNNLEVIANNPIQNNRWNAMNAVDGKIDSKGSYNFDLDTNEINYWLTPLLGTLANVDISSETDASVYSHTYDLANTLPSVTLEQGKGNLTDYSNNRQNHQVDRAYGVMLDTMTMSGSDGIINVAVDVVAHGVFQKADLISNATAGASVDLELESVDGLVATDDTVNIYDETPQNETDAIASMSTTNKTIQIATLGASYTVANKAKVELVPQTPSYSVAAKVFTFDNVSFKFGADLTAAESATEENVENWEFSYANQLEERYGSLRKSPSVIAPKGASSKLTFTKYFENVVDRDRYLSTTKQACIMTITNNEIVSATDTNDAKYTVQIRLSDLRYTTYTMDTGTDGLYAANIEAECYYDTAGGKAVQMVVTNANAGTGY